MTAAALTPWSVEWAVSGSGGTIGVLALSGSPLVRNLGTGDDSNHNATLSGVTC